MMAVRSIYVINGAPAWLSRAARALVVNSGLFKAGTKIEEGVRHENDCQHEKEGQRCTNDCYGFCRTWRRGHQEPREHQFYVFEAKQAGLWNKDGPWKQYPTRMLMHRAAGFHFDDCWSDVLTGLNTVEVLADYPQAAFIGDGETVATHAEPPGRDPLLARATGGVKEAAAGEASGRHGEPDTVVASAPAADSEVPDESAPAASNPDIEPAPDFWLTEPSDMDEVPYAPTLPAKPTRKRSKPVAKDDTYLATCEVTGCGRRFDPDGESHWNYDGEFRCAECGPREVFD